MQNHAHNRLFVLKSFLLFCCCCLFSLVLFCILWTRTTSLLDIKKGINFNLYSFNKQREWISPRPLWWDNETEKSFVYYLMCIAMNKFHGCFYRMSFGRYKIWKVNKRIFSDTINLCLCEERCKRASSILNNLITFQFWTGKQWNIHLWDREKESTLRI